MLVKCVNKACTSPDGTFEFDTSKLEVTGPAQPNEQGAKQFVVECPFCGTKNLIWLKTQSKSYGADITIVKRGSLDFK